MVTKKGEDVMNNSHKTFAAFGLAVIVALFATQSLRADLEVADDEHEFNELLEENKYVVVHFNPYEEDSDEDDDLDETKQAFVNVANKSRYDQAGIMFVGANVPEITDGEFGQAEQDADADTDAEADDLVQELEQLGVRTDKSTFILFKNGKPVSSKDDKVFVKAGDDLDEQDIEKFIERHWGKRIDRILERQKPKRPAGATVVTQPTESVRYVRTYPRYRYRPWYGRRYYGWGHRPWGYYGGFGRRWGRWGRRGGIGFGIGFGFGRGRGFRRW